ncbi:acyl-CoA dehydrogenase [Phenylobacterium aquaticum]|uniref:acyl-CoA dehydrogenase n=1 Tax=Phenylobacterium aquaticum TaxID=1763816 RepID=UPI001F5DA499|nr:acyl-CoA dehydrogenase [Phenylobacterium aquaticum]MCI3133650.1 acyl-CoA dehydrogenase [Phenylobacterium aquaticum]
MTYRAPLRSLALALKTAGHPALVGQAFAELDEDTVTAVLEAAGAFCESELAPLNRGGDQVGAKYANGKVTAAPGFAAAYQAFVAQGWNSLSADPEFGGQGLTKAMELAVFEMTHAANMAFGLCPMLTQGAIEALALHGTERQKTLILPKLVSGEWTGTMNLTEPQAGTDLAAVTTRAEPDGEGGYRLYGQKIFITWGDHDAADNICHLVLARLPDAPPGVKGISLFLATKRLVDDQGQLGDPNDLRPGSIEHKLGIHGSPTCVMLFEGAKAELVGELNNGLAHMFVMMNAARLQVGVQGVAIAERAFQQALAFAQERKQGRTAWGGDGIFGHPDVRRMLTLMKAKIEAARAICITTGVLADLARLAPTEAERAVAKARQELFTPIAKAWSTDVGVEVASLGVQVHGGMGFIEETGAAQHYRDARIAPIYEGTNGVQAIDLAGRKLGMQDGAVMDALCAEMNQTVRDLKAAAGLEQVGERLDAGVAALERATDWMLAHKGPDALSGATAYLKLAGDVIGGWMLGRQALLVAEGDDAWSKSKAALARVYAGQILAQAPGLADGVMDGGADLESLSAEVLGS